MTNTTVIRNLAFAGTMIMAMLDGNNGARGPALLVRETMPIHATVECLIETLPDDAR